LGTVSYGPTEDERGSLQYRRSLYVVEDIKAGELLTEQNVRAIRPGLGLAPKYLNVILDKRVSRDCPKGTPVTWALIG
jgi:sialic acid synthase SpsE